MGYSSSKQKSVCLVGLLVVQPREAPATTARSYAFAALTPRCCIHPTSYTILRTQLRYGSRMLPTNLLLKIAFFAIGCGHNRWMMSRQYVD